MAGAELASRNARRGARRWVPTGELSRDATDGRRWTAGQYRRVFGWVVEQRDRRMQLALDGGMAALTVPQSIAVNAVQHLKRLDACGPVLAVETERPYWIFLAEANGYIASGADLPAEVELLDCGRHIPVPCRDTRSAGLRWVVAPDPRRRWLPTLATVLLAIRSEPLLGR